MNILNIDLDFFLNKRVYCRYPKGNERNNDLYLEPWKKQEVYDFLVNELNVKPDTLGIIVKNHDEVFGVWRELILSGKLVVPFNLVHVDMHADLGFGTRTPYKYFFNDFLRLSLADRMYPREDMDSLHFGSYLLFAIGNRWISEIDMVIYERTYMDDIPSNLLDDDCLRKIINERGDILLDRSYFFEPHLSNSPYGPGTDEEWILRRVNIGEPKIPVNLINSRNINEKYNNINWNFIFLALSPNCTPVTSDDLIPIISQFIKQ